MGSPVPKAKTKHGHGVSLRPEDIDIPALKKKYERTYTKNELYIAVALTASVVLNCALTAVLYWR